MPEQSTATSQPLERSVIEGNEKFVRALLPAKFHHFYDGLVATALQATTLPSASGLHPDTARYHWLADKVIAPDYGDNDSSPHRKGYLLEHCKGSDVIYGDSLDAAIDEMIALEAAK